MSHKSTNSIVVVVVVVVSNLRQANYTWTKFFYGSRFFSWKIPSEQLYEVKKFPFLQLLALPTCQSQSLESVSFEVSS